MRRGIIPFCFEQAIISLFLLPGSTCAAPISVPYAHACEPVEKLSPARRESDGLQRQAPAHGRVPDHSQTQPPLASGTNSGSVVVQPDKSATNVTGTVSTNAVTSPTAPLAVPAAVAAPTTTQPAAAPATPNPIPAPAATQSSNPPAQLVPTDQIVTVIGDIYRNAHVEKVEPDGIIISYSPRPGGMAMTKISFEELPKELRQRYEPKTKDVGR